MNIVAECFEHLDLESGMSLEETRRKCGCPRCECIANAWEAARKETAKLMEERKAKEQKWSLEKRSRDYVLSLFWNKELELALKASKQVPPMKAKPCGFLQYPNMRIVLPLLEEFGQLVKERIERAVVTALEEYFSAWETEGVMLPGDEASGGVMDGAVVDAPTNDMLNAFGCKQAVNEICLGPCDFCYQKSIREITNLRRKKQLVMEVIMERDAIMEDSKATTQPSPSKCPFPIKPKTPKSEALVLEEGDEASCKKENSHGGYGLSYNQSLQLMNMTQGRRQRYKHFTKARRTLYEDDTWPAWPSFLEYIV